MAEKEMPNTIENRYKKNIDEGKKSIKKNSLLTTFMYMVFAIIAWVVYIMDSDLSLIMSIIYLFLAGVSFVSGIYFTHQNKMLFERGEFLWKTVNMVLLCLLLETLPILILISTNNSKLQKITTPTYLLILSISLVIGIVLGIDQYKKKQTTHLLVVAGILLILVVVFTVLGIGRRRASSNEYLQEFWISILGFDNFNILLLVLMELAMCICGLIFVPLIVYNVLKIKSWKKK